MSSPIFSPDTTAIIWQKASIVGQNYLQGGPKNAPLSQWVVGLAYKWRRHFHKVGHFCGVTLYQYGLQRDCWETSTGTIFETCTNHNSVPSNVGHNYSMAGFEALHNGPSHPFGCNLDTDNGVSQGLLSVSSKHRFRVGKGQLFWDKNIEMNHL